jgi:hypothetical protein
MGLLIGENTMKNNIATSVVMTKILSKGKNTKKNTFHISQCLFYNFLVELLYISQDFTDTRLRDTGLEVLCFRIANPYTRRDRWIANPAKPS